MYILCVNRDATGFSVFVQSLEEKKKKNKKTLVLQALPRSSIYVELSEKINKEIKINKSDPSNQIP